MITASPRGPTLGGSKTRPKYSILRLLWISVGFILIFILSLHAGGMMGREFLKEREHYNPLEKDHKITGLTAILEGHRLPHYYHTPHPTPALDRMSALQL